MARKAIVNIFSSYNNILMTATDLTGAETITTCNGGEVVKAGKDKGGQFAATRAAERMADALKDKEFNELIVNTEHLVATCPTTPDLAPKLPSVPSPVRA